MESIKQPTAKSQALTALQVLQHEHFKLLNACHLCGKTAGKHKKMDRTNFAESTYGITLFACHHGFKVCQFCKPNDILKPKWSKKEKKAFKKERVKQLKAAGRERAFRETV